MPFGAGLEVTAAQLNALTAGAPLVAYKSSSTAITSNATPQDDTHLFLPVEANAAYVLDGYLTWVSASATPDFRLDFTAPSGATLTRSFFAQPTTTTLTVGTIDMGRNTGSPGNDDTRGSVSGGVAGMLAGLLVTSVTGGTLQLRWSQAVSDANSVTLETGSWLRLNKVT